MSNYRGDYPLGSTAYFTFTTVNSSGDPTAMDSTSLLEVYKNASTTPSTIGLTLSVSINGRTGLNRVKAILDSTTYATGDEVSISVQTGNVGSKSVVGYVLGSLSIEGRSALRPSVAGRTLAVNSSNVASADVVTVNGDSTAATNLKSAFNDVAGAVPWMGIVDQGTAQAASSNTLTIRSAAAFGDLALRGATALVFGSNQGYWQAVVVSSNVGATDVLSLGNAFAVTPTGTITYKILGSAAAASGAASDVNVVSIASSVVTTIQTNLSTLTQAGIRGAIGMASSNLDTQLSNLSTLSMDGIRGALGLSSSNLDAQLSTIAGAANAIKAKTDSLTFTQTGHVDANVQRINDVTITGDGNGTPFGV